MGLYYEKSENTQRAIELYTQSIEIENSVEPQLNLSVCFDKTGDIAAALKHAREAYYLDTEDSLCLFNYTKLLIKTGDFEKAFEILNESPVDFDEDSGLLKNLLLCSIKLENEPVAAEARKKLKRLNSCDKRIVPGMN